MADSSSTYSDIPHTGEALTALSVAVSATELTFMGSRSSTIRHPNGPSSTRGADMHVVDILTDIPESSIYVDTTNSSPKSSNPFVIIGATPTHLPCSHFLASLGTLHASRWVASAKNKLWWMTPSWGVSAGAVPVETQFLLVEAAAGVYVCLLPLIYDGAFSGMLMGGDSVGKANKKKRYVLCSL
jgi:hypothetical protein